MSLTLAYNIPVHAPAPVFGGDTGSFVFCPLKLTLFYSMAQQRRQLFPTHGLAYAPYYVLLFSFLYLNRLNNSGINPIPIDIINPNNLSVHE
jgi:hypothetical protein